VQEVNGWVVGTLRRHGHAAPMNELVVQMGVEIEAGKRIASSNNTKDLVEAYNKMGGHA